MCAGHISQRKFREKKNENDKISIEKRRLCHANYTHRNAGLVRQLPKARGYTTDRWWEGINVGAMVKVRQCHYTVYCITNTSLYIATWTIFQTVAISIHSELFGFSIFTLMYKRLSKGTWIEQLEGCNAKPLKIRSIAVQ